MDQIAGELKPNHDCWMLSTINKAVAVLIYLFVNYQSKRWLPQFLAGGRLLHLELGRNSKPEIKELHAAVVVLPPLGSLILKVLNHLL